MPKAYDRAEVGIDVEPQSRTASATIDDVPFRILLMGDFTGRASRGVNEPVANRKPVLIDRDNFDQVLARLSPSLGKNGAMRFQDLDDFHPDRIYDRVDAFRALRETRERLQDPETFQVTAREISPQAEPARPPKADIGRVLSGSILDDMVSVTESGAATARAARDPFMEEVRRLVAPYVVPKPDPKQAEMVTQLDAAISGHMAEMLHHPCFQALESSWRSIFLLTRRLETGEQLKLYLLDVSREEMERDLCSVKDLRSSALWRILVEQAVRTPGEHGWAIVAGDYTFGATVEDVGLLARIGMVARQAGAPFLAAADPSIAGCKSFAVPAEVSEWKKNRNEEAETTWGFLRELPEAAWIGLAMPRFIARLPYGKQGESTEHFDFEEMKTPVHNNYLWANPAYACVLLLGESFARSGWEMRAGEFRKISGLPLHTYKENGEVKMKACAEAFFSETAAEHLMDRGLMPFVSYKNQDAIQLLRFQSVASPEKPLAGRWG